MCRIAGILSTRLQPAERMQKVNSMCEVMKHGGPDDSGTFADDSVGLTFGHRRLTVIDLSANGHQPMTDADSKAWINFNGEIYNYLDLRNELLTLGAVFKSSTDTEVILQAYLHWGTAAFGRLRGMFAFALYDVSLQQTYLVRDSNGIKPLYYSSANGDLWFASELKALIAAGLLADTDERWPVWLLAFGHIPEPYTTLKNVMSLAKGHYLKCDNEGHVSISKYTVESSAEHNSIANSFEATIQRQLLADAPIGVFLSGGIDSTLISLLAARYKREQLHTISIYFDEAVYDERQYQDIVLQQLTGEHRKHLVRKDDFDTSFPAILQAMDMPTTDGINTWFISKYAHDDGLKAVLSGLGADELFGGYPSFSRIKYLPYLRQIPNALLKTAEALPIKSYKRLSYLAQNGVNADYLFFRGLFTIRDIAKITGMAESQVTDILTEHALMTEQRAKGAAYAEQLETNLYMQNQLLRDTDVMSMSHGLEVRVPFLDEDFRATVQKTDSHDRFGGERPKQLLVDSFRTLLPQQIWDRPKMGFSFPLQSWMKDNEHITDDTNYHSNVAKQVISDFRDNRTHWSKAFALYQVQGHV